MYFLQRSANPREWAALSRAPGFHAQKIKVFSIFLFLQRFFSENNLFAVLDEQTAARVAYADTLQVIDC